MSVYATFSEFGHSRLYTIPMTPSQTDRTQNNDLRVIEVLRTRVVLKPTQIYRTSTIQPCKRWFDKPLRWKTWLNEIRAGNTNCGKKYFGNIPLGKMWRGKTFISTTVFCLWIALFSQPAFSTSAQLIMVEETHCPFCARFNAEIAPVYPKTTEGNIAPLRRVSIDEGWPDDLSHIETESLTPTFILIQDNRELGRLYGYQGDEFFWFLLGELFEKLEPVTDKAN